MNTKMRKHRSSSYGGFGQFSMIQKSTKLGSLTDITGYNSDMPGSHEVESSNLSRSTSQPFEDASPARLLQMQ
jgi:hypothetical protein